MKKLILVLTVTAFAMAAQAGDSACCGEKDKAACAGKDKAACAEKAKTTKGTRSASVQKPLLSPKAAEEAKG